MTKVCFAMFLAMGQYLCSTYSCMHELGCTGVEKMERQLAPSHEPARGAWPHVPFWVTAA